MGINFWQLIFLAFWILVIGYPIALILKRMGINRLWVLVAFIPLVNLIGLWVLAFKKWPIDR